MAPQNTSLGVREELNGVEGVGSALVSGVTIDIHASTHLAPDLSCPASTPLPPTAPHTNKPPAAPPSAKEDQETTCLVDDGGGSDGASTSTRCSCRSPDVDGGWSWVVLVAAFLQFFVTSAIYYSFSVFFVELLATFKESRARTGWVYSSNTAVFMFSGPLGGWALARWGTRATLNLGGLLAALGYLGSAFAPNLNYIFLFYSVLNGMGTSFTFSGWVVGLSQFWVRRHALAMGVAMAGSGCGVLLLGPKMEVLVGHYGWRGAMVICAGLYLHLCVFASTLYTSQRPPPCRFLLHDGEKEEAGSEKEGPAAEARTEREKQRQSPRQVLCSPAFCLLAGSCFLSTMATTTVFAVLRDWAELEGLGAAFSSALAGSGAGDLLGRVLAGLLVGRGCQPMLLFSSVQLLLAATIGFAATASVSSQLIAAMVGFGMACGLHSVTYALMPSQLTTGQGVGHVLGCLLFVTGIGALVGPPVVGAMVDFSQSYGGAMLLITVAPAAAAVLNVAAFCCFRIRLCSLRTRAGADP